MMPLRPSEKSQEALGRTLKIIYDFVRSSEVSYFGGGDRVGCCRFCQSAVNVSRVSSLNGLAAEKIVVRGVLKKR